MPTSTSSHPLLSTRATAFALNILAIHLLGDAISPPLIGWIAGKSNMNVAFMVVSAMMAVASVFWFIGARYLGRDTAAITATESGSSNISSPSA